MLPGFRFLVAAIIVSLSVLVFGLGAAALLRAAHEQFASNASWRATPETSYTTFLPQAEPTRPVLAMLRVDPAPASPAALELQPSPTPTETASTEAAPTPPAEVTPAPVISPQPEASPSPEPATPPAPSADAGQTVVAVQKSAQEPVQQPAEITAKTPGASEPAPPADIPTPEVTSTPAPVAEMVQDPPQSTPAPSADIQALVAPAASTPPAPWTDPATKLAALGGQPTALENNASVRTAGEQLRQSLDKKRQAKEQAKQRAAKEKLAEAKRKRHRRMVQRARAARQAALAQQQQLNDPFGQQQQSLTTASTGLSASTGR